MPVYNTTQKNQDSMAPAKPMIARPDYSNTAEALENDLKNNFMEMSEVLKAIIKNSLKEIVKKTTKILRKSRISLKSIKTPKKKQTNR